MQKIKMRLKDGEYVEAFKGVMWLDSEDLYPQLTPIGEKYVEKDSSSSIKELNIDGQALQSCLQQNSSDTINDENDADDGFDELIEAQLLAQVEEIEEQAKHEISHLSKTTKEDKAVTQATSNDVKLDDNEKTNPQAELKASIQDNNQQSAEQETISKNSEESLKEKDNISCEGEVLSSIVKPRSFASLQLRARNAMRALFRQKQEHLLVVCASSSVDAISTCADLVKEVANIDPIIAYAPNKLELFGTDKEDGIVTTGEENKYAVVIMPCVHLADHPKWLGMMDACLAQNPYLKLILCGDGSDIAALSMLWPTLDNALHTDIVLEFPAALACNTIAGLISHYQLSNPDLLPFSAQAVSLLTAWCCRMSGDRRYIGLLERSLQSLIYEANNYCLQEGRDDLNLVSSQPENTKKPKFVRKYHVLKALAADDFRNNFLADSSLRDHRDRQLLIATEGKVVGQINGLSVIETLGTSYEYGEPVRITATIRAGGEGDVIDIERKAELAGQIHAKAMMIINGFLTKEFGAEQPLPVSASLVFEQSYSEVDGDSASLTGLCAIISGLANLPIRQDLAVTGAVDQFGDVQAVGGVNEKIEGFFRVCRLNGLTGTQGVIIPSACLNQLVLRPCVVKAVAERKFHIFTVNHVTEAMNLLTGASWGDSETENTVCYKIVERFNNIISGASEESWWDKIKGFTTDLIEKIKTQKAIAKLKEKLKQEEKKALTHTEDKEAK